MAEISADRILIRNFREFRHKAGEVFEARYEDREFDLRKLSGVDFIMVPFAENKDAAHTCLSFAFEDGRHIAVSVEARREKGEAYSILRGCLKRYEIIYVIGDDLDLLGQRIFGRGDRVFIYPAKTSVENARSLLLDILNRANSLQERPEFYNTLTNNCTTTIVRHVNRIAPGKVKWDLRIWWNGYSDALAFELGLLESGGLSLEALRKKCEVAADTKDVFEESGFSEDIRAGTSRNQTQVK